MFPFPTPMLVSSASSVPSVTSGTLVGQYDATSVSGFTWSDLSGAGNHAAVSGLSVVSASGNNMGVTANVVQGGTSSTVLWPTAILPSTYTLIHLCRYQGTANKGRIMNSYDQNWLSGFYSGQTGRCYHNGWMTLSDLGYGNTWFVSVDQNSLYRAKKSTVSTSGAGSPSYGRLSINTSTAFPEASDFQVAEVLVYSGTLSSADYGNLENYLYTKYALT